MTSFPKIPSTTFHPIQRGDVRQLDCLPIEVTMAAYEVYAYVYGPQEAMITGGCRGGFGAGEIMAFLYARPFPKEQWSARVDLALRRKP